MRYVLALPLLLLAGCVHKDSADSTLPPTSAAVAAENQVDPEPDWIATPPEVLASPFLPALAKAGLWPRPHVNVVIRSIDYCGTISVEDQPYLVLYIHSHLQLTEYNERGHSSWLICDTEFNPVWQNPDWGGTPGECFENHVRVNLQDKFFEIRDEYAYGDFLTFRREEDHLVASIGWESDETMIAQFLNWPKWRDHSHEPDEAVTHVRPVDGHPNWRIVLTQYPALYHQGCAHLIAVDERNEFGCRLLCGIWSDQACRPVDAGSARVCGSRDTIVWVDYESRSGYRYRHTAVLRDGRCIRLANERLKG